MTRMPSGPVRHGHAVLDLASRRHKGEKIERLLGLEGSLPRRMLEIGTGSGGIAHYFATHSGMHLQVDAVDVTDSRQVSDGYAFQLVESTELPFADATFDIVLTNHVIEHVGDRLAQRAHLREIRRVLKPDGIVYLAVPNRWMLVEPHYRLAFLSWWPHGWRSTYLRLAGKGGFYDCEPLEQGEVESLAREVGFAPRNRTVDAFRLTLAIEGDKGWVARRVASLSDRSLGRLTRVIPTHIYTMRVAE